MFRDRAAASSAEYALLIAIVGGGIAVAAAALGSAVGNSMADSKSCLENPSESNPACS